MVRPFMNPIMRPCGRRDALATPRPVIRLNYANGMKDCCRKPNKSRTTIPYGGMTRVKFPGRSLATSSQPYGSRSLRLFSVGRCDDNAKPSSRWRELDRGARLRVVMWTKTFATTPSRLRRQPPPTGAQFKTCRGPYTRNRQKWRPGTT